MKLVLCKHHNTCECKTFCNHAVPHAIVTGEPYLSGENCYLLNYGGYSVMSHFCDCLCDEKYIRNEKLKKLKK